MSGSQHRPTASLYLPAPCNVAISVLDQEVHANRQLWFPTSMENENYEQYAERVEQIAGDLAADGGQIFYAFVDPPEFAKWCSETGHPVDSGDSRATWARQLVDADLAYPYEPDGLVEMGIHNIVCNSELGELFAGENEGPEDLMLAGYQGNLVDWLDTKPGHWQQTVTAARHRDHSEVQMWEHFWEAVKLPAAVTFCDEYLSVAAPTHHDSTTVYNCDQLPFQSVTCLGLVGHGLLGIVYRHGKDFTFRAWELSPAGVVPVSIDKLGKMLGTPGAPSLRSGWPSPSQPDS